MNIAENEQQSFLQDASTVGQKRPCVSTGIYLSPLQTT